MRDESKQVPQYHSDVQRAIVLLILEHSSGLARSELTAELGDLAPNTLAEVLAALTEEGVIVAEEDRFRAARCVRHLDALSPICV